MQPDNEPKPDGWSFHLEGGQEEKFVPESEVPAPRAETISWTGSEFLDQHKSASWYFGLFGFIAVVCGVVYFISKDFISVGFIAIMGILFAIIAGRKPRQLQYAIDDQGIHIGRRSYVFSEFKSFSLQREGAMGYINLLPLKRLHSEISIYYPPEDEQKIFDALSQRIPHEDHKETFIDKFTRMIRF